MLQLGLGWEVWTQAGTSSTVKFGEPKNLLISSPATHQRARWKQILDRLIAISKLEDNWDGEGAEAPDFEIIDSVTELLIKHTELLPHPNRIVPSVDGAIVVEWQLDGTYLEAEVETTNLAEWMLRTPDGVITHWEERIAEPETSTTEYLFSDSDKEAA